MKAKCHSIEDKIDFTDLIASNDVVGFCYPVYGSRVPRIMREFVNRHTEALKDKKLIIFCTQMYFSGDGARAFTDIFPRGHATVIYAEHFLMPNNVCNLFITPLPSKKSIESYIKKAERKMRTVCDEITKGIVKKRGFNPVSRALGLIQGVFYPKFEKAGMDKVWVGDGCTQCNLCVTVCPMNNFENKNGKITPQKNCVLCYRCINKCPQKAISVCFRKKVKKQYKGLYEKDTKLE
jgi:ferredoxin